MFGKVECLTESSKSKTCGMYLRSHIKKFLEMRQTGIVLRSGKVCAFDKPELKRTKDSTLDEFGFVTQICSEHINEVTVSSDYIETCSVSPIQSVKLSNDDTHGNENSRTRIPKQTQLDS